MEKFYVCDASQQQKLEHSYKPSLYSNSVKIYAHNFVAF